MNTIFATASCVGCESGGGDLSFYQVAASVFVVLLLTGVAGEIRELRVREGSNESPKEISWWYSSAVAFVLAALLLGELVSLAVLLDPPPSDFAQVFVAICLAISVIGVPILVVLAMWDEHLRKLRRSLIAVFVTLIAMLVIAGGYLASVAVRTSPAQRLYHVYGTCASGECGLNERSAPRVNARSLGKLRDGDEVSIVCQTIGGEVPDPQGGSSIVWDRLESGAYITDVYVDTPPAGSEIDLCEGLAESGARG